MMIGQRIGPFELREELGSGAMGTVYKAVYKDGRFMALKFISLGLAANETAMQRFEREGTILKQLRHPNIVGLFATGRAKGVPYIAMEFVKGESVDRMLVRRGRCSWEEVVRLGEQVCRALQHAHEKGIIHRDLKPSNLLRIEDGTVKLTDFGIAKDLDVTALTDANNTVGTAAYMSPEQCRGEKVTSKSDLYSLGVVMFELLTGRKPFVAESPVDMFMKHVSEPPPRPNWVLKGSNTGEIPTWLETIVLQMMDKKPEHRPLDAGTVAKALNEGMEKFYAGRSAAVDAVQARAGDRRIQTSVLDEADRDAARALRSVIQKKRIRKKRAPVYSKAWFIAPLVVLLLLGLGGLLWLATRPPSPDSLYHKAERKMAEHAYMEALYRIDGSDGPVREFLRRYPNDPNAAQVRAWQDEAESGDLMEKLKHNAGGPKFRKNYFDWQKVEPNYEAHAFEAMKYEDYGDLQYAGEHWRAAWRLAEKDPEQRVAKRLAELRSDKLAADWKAQMAREPEVFTSEKSYRTTLLNRKLEEARKLKSEFKMKDLQKLAEDTMALYKDDKDPDVSKLAEQIHEQFKKKGDDRKSDDKK